MHTEEAIADWLEELAHAPNEREMRAAAKAAPEMALAAINSAKRREVQFLRSATKDIEAGKDAANSDAVAKYENQKERRLVLEQNFGIVATVSSIDLSN